MLQLQCRLLTLSFKPSTVVAVTAAAAAAAAVAAVPVQQLQAQLRVTRQCYSFFQLEQKG
jgi:hypothetical protein